MHFISAHIEVLTGYPASDFIDDAVRSFASIIVPEDREHVSRVVEDALSRGGSFSLEYRLVHADGSERWVAEHGRVVIGREGRPLWIDGVILDVSQQEAAEQLRDRDEEQLRHQAGHDALTGLPNRALVLDRAEQMLLRSKRNTHLIGAFYVDLDNFKVDQRHPRARGRRRAAEVGGRSSRGCAAGKRHRRAAWWLTSSWSWPRESRCPRGPSCSPRG